MVKSRNIQIVALALAVTLMYSAIGYIVFYGSLVPRTEEMDKVDIQKKKRAKYYERVGKNGRAVDIRHHGK
ncbi:hypothetical protein [Priestia aryabhattai]|uniref:hypothetical protein n=1 Tax=Priestia aryabhattai TaxID=412384 RepID=UPI001C8DE64C|nr:hypothetical protein [Priestia aryabhattai]MBY0214126.1 hypothetical protein [Priestia aryabhattai]